MTHIAFVVVVLLLCSVAAAAPVATRTAAAAAAAPDGRPAVPKQRSTIVRTKADVIKERDCPGFEANGTVCGKTCQLRLCKALAAFYKASNNVTDPWDNEKGWEVTQNIPCEQLVATSPRQAVYCSWFGVACCTPDGMREQQCSVLNSVTALELPINNVNASLQNPALLPSLKILHGCGMRVLNLEANNLVGQLHDEWGDLDKLIVFNIGNGWVSGTIPDTMQRLRNVTLINISNNWLNGTFPAWVANLTELRVLNLGSNQGDNAGSTTKSGEPMLGLRGTIPPEIGQLTKLRELNLEANSLTGELPRQLCSENSSLLMFNVRGNQLEGDARGVKGCSSLVQLDISQNYFSGSLPASTDWDELATYRAASNQFSGRFPMTLTSARILEHLDIGSNQLTGMIPPQVTLLSSLKTFVLSNNRLSGTVNENLYYLPALAKMDLSKNALVGTFPNSVGLAYGMTEMDLSNNPGLTGVLPPQMGVLDRLKQVRLHNTSVSCAGVIRPYIITTNNSCSDPKRCISETTIGNSDTRYHACSEAELLPCFLTFSAYMIPRDDDSNMRCKNIVRRPVNEAKTACAATYDQSLQLPDLSAANLQQLWLVDPSYFQYRVCECLMGYTGVWDANGTVLRCLEAGPQTPTAIIVGVVAAAAVLIIGLLAWLQYLTTRPRWLRERILQAKRSRGAPKASKPGDKVAVSIVVTDVKDFSDLTRQYPDLMNKAMGIHNNILRKASHNHAGYIMDQEGDSWTIAFHDAEDAVAFSLQVQQALAQRSWGKLRMASHHELSDLTTMRDGVFSTRFSNTHQSSMDSVAVRQSSSSFGMLGDESFTANHNLDSIHSKLNASFSSSNDKEGGGERSFIMIRKPGSDDGATNSHAFAASALRGGAGTGIKTSTTGAGGTPGVNDSSAKLGNGSLHIHHQHGNHHNSSNVTPQPDHRQVSFSDAVASRDASAFHHPAPQQQLLRLLRSDSDDNMARHAQGGGWSGDVPSIPPVSAAKQASFDCTPPGLDPRANSLSITVASRGRSSGSGSRLWHTSAAMMRRLSTFGRGNLNTGTPTPGDAPHQPSLHLTVRIGVATGSLMHGCDLNNSVVKDRAKNYVSEVANGGQILMDENTFRAIKDSLSVLGTVNESGYDDRQLQQLLHNRVVNRLQHHISCGTCACYSCSWGGPREPSFTSVVQSRDIQDYDNDALVVHMGAFEPPPQGQQQRRRKQLPQGPSTTTDSSQLSSPSEDEVAEKAGPPVSKDKDAAKERRQSGTAAGRDGKERAAGRTSGIRKAKALHLYAVAAPGMRRIPNSTHDIRQCLSWAAPVDLKRRWCKVQKGYFDAPGARSMDLAPLVQIDQAPLPDVVIVFAQVVGGSGFTHKRNRTEAQSLKKAIKRCMLQMLDELPEQEDGRDGYLCRCQEADLKYMVAFRYPHTAVQWCMLVQEALMYYNWPESILSHPGFEEVLDVMTGLPLFRGPRLRMGFAVGQPNSVLPDHTGRANYYGHSVNRAARFMEAAAHGGQIVTDIDTARRLMHMWRQDRLYDSIESKSITPSRAHSDADTHPVVSTAGQPDDAALLQALGRRSLSETAGNCRPSTSRVPLSRLALRHQQQQQSLWVSQLHGSRPQQQSRQQIELTQQLTSVPSREGALSSPLPGAAQPQQQQQFPMLQVPQSGGSFTRSHARWAAAVPESSEGMLMSRQPVQGSGVSFTRQQTYTPPGSFTRQHVVASGGSFTRRQPPSPAAAVTISALSQQGTSMGASFSTRHNFTDGSTVAAQQQCLVQHSAHSFVLQVPEDWEVLDVGEVQEAVTVLYLGTFSFKGSGVYDMVNILPLPLLARQFPEDAPKGKGYRVMSAQGPATGVESAVLVVPRRLMAARQAFKARQSSMGGESRD